MSQQLSFDLPVKPALGRDDFMIAPSNALAVAMLETFETWDGGKLVLSGPAGAGKTHLAHVWAHETGGVLVPARDLAHAALDDLALDDLAQTPLVIEDVPLVQNDPEAQTALFHVHNLMRAARLPLLLTGRGAPNHWQMSLPDLQSRIDAAGVAPLNAPDDTLLAAVLGKLFSDRQLTPRSDVIPYLILRMDRSFEAARIVVAEMDAASLAHQKPLTRALAATVLDKIN